VVVLWKAAWRFGPGLVGGSTTSPAIFALHARVLLKANLAFPRRVEALLPAPEKGTSAEAQLRLMGLWDGKAWTAKAASTGRIEGRHLRVPAGRIDFARIAAISEEKVEGDRRTCRIDYRIRWDWPDQDRELLRVAAIIGLKTPAPAGFQAPGLEAPRALVLEREGWGWRLQEPRASQRELGGGDSRWSWLARFL
jgi:hypothetical protein